MNPKDEAVERQAVRCRSVNVEYATIRKEYAPRIRPMSWAGAAVEVVDKHTSASCRLFLHELGDDDDKGLIRMIDAAGAALDALLKK